METRASWPADLEIRQGGRTISGAFRYGSVATVRDRGRVRKESFAPRAFRFAVDDTEREINLLLGHDFNNPIASRRAGSLVVEDGPEALVFRAELPEEAAQTIAQVDAVKQLRQGLVGGISPGFRVPPASAVPNAETLLDEPGNPGVQIRRINEAVLFEISLVARPAYPDTEADVRHDIANSARVRKNNDGKSTRYPALGVLRWL